MQTFDIIEVDAPHQYNSRNDNDRMRGGAVRQYPLMTDKDLDGLGSLIRPLMSANNLLYYWTTGPKAERSCKTIEAWGYEIKTIFGLIWIKTNKGKKSSWVKLYELEAAIARTQAGEKKYLQAMPAFAQAGVFFGNGFYSKANAETCILAKRGTGMKPARDDVSSVIIAPIREHSRKPWEAHYRIEAMYPEARKLELFARRESAGWTCLGNELDGMDIRESLLSLYGVNREGWDWHEWLKNPVTPF
jgi:N6-adenosine-specific RNA methylase IME4